MRKTRVLHAKHVHARHVVCMQNTCMQDTWSACKTRVLNNMQNTCFAFKTRVLHADRGRFECKPTRNNLPLAPARRMYFASKLARFMLECGSIRNVPFDIILYYIILYYIIFAGRSSTRRACRSMSNLRAARALSCGSCERDQTRNKPMRRTRAPHWFVPRVRHEAGAMSAV